MYTYEDLYKGGDYLAKNPTWHAEEAPWKVRHIVRLLASHGIAPASIGDVGCGVGEVLRLLQPQLANACELWGYDISPRAHAIAKAKENDRLHFILGNFTESESTFDLILALDLIEHVEDYFSILRNIKKRSVYKIFHIPLDISVQTIIRGRSLIKKRRQWGHIHYFTKETALQTLIDTGYEIVDSVYTLPTDARDLRHVGLRLLLDVPFFLSKDWAVRLLGVRRLLVLAK